jgi:hypothetical protein
MEQIIESIEWRSFWAGAVAAFVVCSAVAWAVGQSHRRQMDRRIRRFRDTLAAMEKKNRESSRYGG